MLSTKQIREMIRCWPISRIQFSIHGARLTMRHGSATVCARHIAIMRAELSRRESLDTFTLSEQGAAYLASISPTS